MKKKRERKPSEIPATMADVIRAKAEATNKASRLAVIIFFSVLLEKRAMTGKASGGSGSTSRIGAKILKPGE